MAQEFPLVARLTRRDLAAACHSPGQSDNVPGDRNLFCS